MDLVPTSDSVIIKELKHEEQSKGGVILPTAFTPSLGEGRVIAVGPGPVALGHRVSLDVREGDIIVYVIDAFPIQPILEEGEQYSMIRGSAIIAYRKSAREEQEACAT